MWQNILIILILISASAYLIFYFARSSKRDKCESCKLKELVEKKR